MNRMERFSAWRARNVLPLDVLGTLAIALFMVGLAASTGNTPGILFAHDPTSQMVWSLVSLVPVMFRRWHPQAAALFRDLQQARAEDEVLQRLQSAMQMLPGLTSDGYCQRVRQRLLEALPLEHCDAFAEAA